MLGGPGGLGPPPAGLRVRGELCGGSAVPAGPSRGAGAQGALQGLCEGSAGQGCSSARSPPPLHPPGSAAPARCLRGKRCAPMGAALLRVPRVFGVSPSPAPGRYQCGGPGVSGLWQSPELGTGSCSCRCCAGSHRDTRWVPSCHSCERVLAGESWDSLTLPVLGQAVPSPAEKEGKRGHQFGHRWRPVPDPDAGLMTEVVQKSPASLTCWKTFIAVGKASPSKLTSPSMELIASATAQMLPAAGAAACLRPVMPFGITQGMLQEHGVGLELSRKTDGMAGASLSFCIRWEDALGWVTSLPMARGWN